MNRASAGAVPVVDQVGGVGDEELAPLGDDGTKPGQLVVVAYRYFEHRESPHAPSFVTLLDGAEQQIVVDGSRTQAHEHESGRRNVRPQRQCFDHDVNLSTALRPAGLHSSAAGINWSGFYGISPVTYSDAIGNELLELVDRKREAAIDADRGQLVVPDQLVDRRSAERQNLGGSGDRHEQWGVS